MHVCVRVLGDELVLLRNNGIRGQIEHEGVPSTLSQHTVFARARVSRVTGADFVCLFEFTLRVNECGCALSSKVSNPLV